MDIDYNVMLKRKVQKIGLVSIPKTNTSSYLKLQDIDLEPFTSSLEIDKKYKILKSAKNIMDLGSSQDSGLSIFLGIIVIKTLLAIDLIDMDLSRTSILSMEISTI